MKSPLASRFTSFRRLRAFGLGASAAAALLAGAGAASGQTTYTWAGALTGTDSWDVATNWNPNTGFPNAIGDGAIVGVDFTAAKTINLNQAITVGALTLGDSNATTPSAVTLAVGTAGSMIFDNTTGNATMTSQGASNTISAPITLTDSLDLTTNSSVTLSNNITGAGTLNKVGAVANTISLNGNSPAWSGGLNVRQGTIQLGGSASAVLGTGTVTFANQLGDAGNTVAFNRSSSLTLVNNFVQNNAAAVTGTQYASIGYFGGTLGNRIQLLTGSFSTGANFNGANSQGIVFQANGTSQGVNVTTSVTGAGGNEGSLRFTGDWSGFAGGATNTQAIRIGTGGFIIDAQQAIAASGSYRLDAATSDVGAKLALTNNVTSFARDIVYAGSANGSRNSVGGTQNTGNTITLSGGITNNNTAGGNLFAQTAGATVNVTGTTAGISGAGALVVNEGYTLVTANAVAGTAAVVNLPVGTINLSRTAGNTYTGGTSVRGGTLLANNTTGSATGTGSLTVGLVSAAVTGQTGSVTNTGTSAFANVRSIQNINTAFATGLQVGQTITGTGIPAGAVITAIALGNGAANSTITINQNLTTQAGAGATVSYPDIAVGAFTSTGTLGGAGRIAPTGANVVTVNTGSTLAPGNSPGILTLVSAQAGGTTLGTATLGMAAGSIFSAEITGTTVGTQYDQLLLSGTNPSVFLAGNLTLTLGGFTPAANDTFTIINNTSAAGTLTGAFANAAFGTGTFTSGGVTFNVTNGDGNDVVLIAQLVPEPSTYALLGLGLGGLGFAVARRRRSAALAV